MEGKAQDSQDPPSTTLHKIETTLHGLSFGEHDGGEQRRSLSRILATIATSFTSGLLQANHGPVEHEAVSSSIETLLTTPLLTDTITWTALPQSVAESLITHYWHKAFLQTTPTSPPTTTHLPTTLAATSLHAAHTLQTLASPTNSPPLGAHLPPGDAIFAALRIRLSESQNPSPSSFPLVQADKTLSLLRILLNLPSEPLLLARVFPSLANALQAANRSSLPAANLPAYALCPLPMLLRHVADALATANALPRRFPLLLPLLLPHLNEGERHARATALHALSTALTPDIDLTPYVAPLASALSSALVWGDSTTAVLVGPLLMRVVDTELRKGGSGREVMLADQLPDVVERVLKLLFREVGIHLQGAERRVPDAILGESPMQHADACVALGRVVVDVARERLLEKADSWVSGLGALLVRVAWSVARQQCEVELFESTAEVLVESMRWTWLLEYTFRNAVFEGCMCSVLEVRWCEEGERRKVSDVCMRVLRCLADCAGTEAVLELVDVVLEESTKYKSLRAADKFFKEVRRMLCDREERRPIQAGRLVKKFFPEIK